MASMRLPPLPSVRDIIKLYRLSATKQLSQNFLLDDKLTDKIVKCTGKICDSGVLEVGPGPGTITRSILRKSPKRLVVVEKDPRFKPTLDLLQDAFSVTNRKMDIILGDILSVNLKELLAEEDNRAWSDECPSLYLVGNLPFNISTPLIIKWLHDIAERRGAWSNGRVRMTLTFQKEVAERLVAQPSDDQRCRLSVIAQAWTIPKLQFIIPGKAFVPQPDVDVGVVSFVPLKIPRTSHEFEFFEKVNRHMFSFRQKYCVKCVRTLYPPECTEQLADVTCKLADVDPLARPFNLSVEEIDRLASAYKYICEKHPEVKHYNYRASRKVLSRKMTRGVVIENYEGEDENCNVLLKSY
ncbi:hypothetical protein QAD02_019458 [Eretmocerus hayati]|uniref:Uncharacterized protein n=1 Tax=Eretmocerus hayati TaxID=131215 RepID=A0ACC2PLH2_9HYME|nr:hypothetical protein QAD02_019458 [Eretmocerus hayati]